MSTGRKNSRLELVVIGVFFILFSFWALSRCNNKRAEMRRQMEAEAQEELRQDSLDRAAAMARMLPPKDTTQAAPAAAAPQVIKEQVTPLYVVLDELNMRGEPKLNGRLVARLKLYDELVYLNEVTEFKEEINLGGVTYNEPWIKVKNKSGKVGWVYGAGVHFYRLRRES
jgi:hypothetical protein